MIWLKMVKSFVKILNSNASPSQIAWGIALGFLVGITPFFSLVNLFFLLLILMLNVNMAGAFLSAGLFAILSLPFGFSAHSIGYYALVKVDALTALWTLLYNMPLAPFTRFNNTVMMGSLIIGIVLVLPVFFVFRVFVVRYRNDWRMKLENVKFFKILGLTKFINWYNKLSGAL